MKRMTIDPGANSSGWAIWDKKWTLIDNGICTPDPKDEWELRALANAQNLLEIAEHHEVDEGYIEYPAFFQTHGAGVATSGALVKLAYYVGLVCGTMPFPVKIVTVGEWKGQLPKKVVIERIKRILPGVEATKDDWDAIGIGLFLSGKMM